MKGLTENQEAVMAALKLHGGFWHVDCGWLWGGTPSATIRQMDALEKKGMLTSRPFYKQFLLYQVVEIAPFDINFGR